MDRLDWRRLKMEYMLSDTLSVVDFLRDKLGQERAQKRSGFIARKTLGWKKEKEELKDSSAQDALSKIMKQRAQQLACALAATYDVLASKSLDQSYMSSLPLKDLHLYLSMLITSNELIGNKGTDMRLGQTNRLAEDRAAFQRLKLLLKNKRPYHS